MHPNKPAKTGWQLLRCQPVFILKNRRKPALLLAFLECMYIQAFTRRVKTSIPSKKAWF